VNACITPLFAQAACLMHAQGMRSAAMCRCCSCRKLAADCRNVWDKPLQLFQRVSLLQRVTPRLNMWHSDMRVAVSLHCQS